MPDGNRQIDGRSKLYHSRQGHQEKLHNQGHHAGVLHNAPEDIGPEWELEQVGQVQGEHNEGGEKAHGAAYHPCDRAADELGGHQLPGADREGVHEVALVPQQALGKSLDHKQNGNDEHSRHNGGEGKNHQPGGLFSYHRSAVLPVQCKPVHQCQHQRRPPDEGKLLPHSPEVVF